MKSDSIKRKEEFKEYIDKLNKFKAEVIYIFYLMKKYNYGDKKEMLNLNKDYLELMYKFDFSDIINGLLWNTTIPEEDKHLLRTISQYTELIYQEHIRTNIDLKTIYDSTDEKNIIQCMNEYLNEHNDTNFKNIDMQFEIFANTLLKKDNKTTNNKTLVFTDSFKLIMYIIKNKIEADVIYKEMENDFDESKLFTQIQIFIKILGLSNKIKISQGDILINTYDENKKHDLVVIVYLYKYKISTNTVQNKLLEKRKFEKLSKKTSISNEYFFINEAYKYLKSDGTINSIISNIALYKTADDEIKKEMIDKKMIKSIITIPKFFNTPNYKREQNIITIEEGNDEIEFKYYDKIESLAKPELCKSSKKIKTKDIIDYDLRPRNILFDKNINNENTNELGNFLIDCYRGCQISSLNYNDNGQFELLTVSDMNDGIIEENLKKFNYEKKNMEKFLRFLLKEKDILISTHGSKIKIAMAENIMKRKIIPNTNIIVLRSDSNRINPYYLEAYLTTKVGMQALEDISTGESNIIINDVNMRKLLIPVKDLNKQNAIGKIVKTQREEITFLKKRLKEALDEKNSFSEEKIIGDVIND